ncbi:MAG: hypothetical protein IRZ03_17830 [Acidobacterium ailaaui]|nr:hypothetical protein [Pseudacidobacterium ailaaui]
MNKKIIFRLKRNGVINHKTDFSYDVSKEYIEQLLELRRYGYINQNTPQSDSINLHIYYSFLYMYETGNLETTINMPFNHTNGYYLYIDYLYYSRAINELNFIILINKKYLINIDEFKVSDEDIFSDIKEGDTRYNKDTYKLISVESSFAIK